MAILMRVFVSLAITSILFKFAIGVDHTVGAPNGGWDFSTDYTAWAASLKFIVGDTLTFSYLSPYHDVVEVSEADYTTCSNTSPIKTYSGGLTTISLDTSGMRYFICGVPGHCSAGMKIEINTLSGPTPGAPSPILEPVAAPPMILPASPMAPPPTTLAPTSPPPSDATTTSPVPSPSSESAPQDSSTPSSSPKSSPPAVTSPPPSVSSPKTSPPSSANKYAIQTSVAVGVGFVLMMVLVL